MTYNQLHEYQYKLSRVLNAEFKEQLLEIHPKAHLCYQGHCQVFTVSLFILEKGIDPFEWNEYLSANVNVLSAFDIDDKVKALTYAISSFIMNKGPEHDHTINHST